MEARLLFSLMKLTKSLMQMQRVTLLTDCFRFFLTENRGSASTTLKIIKEVPVLVLGRVFYYGGVEGRQYVALENCSVKSFENQKTLGHEDFVS